MIFVCRNLPRHDPYYKGFGLYTFRHAGRTGRFIWLGPLHIQIATGR